MVAKTAILLLACILGSQAATLQEARHRLDVFLEDVDTAYKRAVNQMENLEEVIRQLSNSVINIGTQEVHRESGRLVKDLDDAVEGARKDGFNVDICLKGERELLVEITQLSGLELAACANRFTSQAEGSLEKAMTNLDNIVDDVYNVSDRLDKCSAADANCINGLVTIIERYEIDIPRRIQEDWDIGQNRAEANRLYLSECGIKATENLVTHGAALVNTVDMCVDKIIHPPRPLAAQILKKLTLLRQKVLPSQ